MKKLVIIYVVLIAAVIFLAVARGGGNLLSFLPTLGRSSVAQINNTKINLLIANNASDREKGLSGRKGLDANQGMLFLFEQKGKYPFWMRDMLFSIDIIYIDDTKIVEVFKKVPIPTGGLIPRVNPTKDANYVLELNAGEADKLKIKEGTTIKFIDLPKASK